MARAKAAAPAKTKGSWGWMQGLVCGAVVTMATPSALLIAVLLAPSGLAFILDRTPRRLLTRPVFLLGLATAAQPMLLLWRAGHSLDAALGLVTDPSVVVLAWAAQASGWLLAEMLPVVIGLVMQGSAAARAARLRAARRSYEEQWDIPPREDAP